MGRKDESCFGVRETFTKKNGEEVTVGVGGGLDTEHPGFPEVTINLFSPLKKDDYPRVKSRSRTVKHDGNACVAIGLSLEAALSLHFLLGHVLEPYQAFVDHKDPKRYQEDLDTVLRGG